MSNTRIVPAVVALAAILAGCGRKGEEAKETSTAAAPAVVESKGVVPSRHEAQEHFDSARVLFVAKDNAGAASELRAASAFLREHADSAIGESRKLMLDAVAALDKLSVDVEKNTVRTISTLELAFARAQRAEAKRHSAAALEAWKKNEYSLTATELTYAIDHLERAVRDANVKLSDNQEKVMSEARDVARELMQNGVSASRDAGKTIEALGKQIDEIGMGIDKIRK